MASMAPAPERVGSGTGRCRDDPVRQRVVGGTLFTSRSFTRQATTRSRRPLRLAGEHAIRISCSDCDRASWCPRALRTHSSTPKRAAGSGSWKLSDPKSSQRPPSSSSAFTRAHSVSNGSGSTSTSQGVTTVSNAPRRNGGRCASASTCSSPGGAGAGAARVRSTACSATPRGASGNSWSSTRAPRAICSASSTSSGLKSSATEVAGARRRCRSFAPVRPTEHQHALARHPRSKPSTSRPTRRSPRLPAQSRWTFA
jgi:hypothetical protein